MKLLPPPSSKKEQKITLNLSQFVPPSIPQPKPPAKSVSKSVPPAVSPSPATEAKAEKASTPAAKRKRVEEKKGLEVAKKSAKENNATKTVKTETEKPKKRKIAKAKHQKPVKKKRTPEKKPLPKHFRIPKHSKDRLASALLGGMKQPAKRSSRAQPANTRADRMIKRLYGKEFYSYTKTQQKFIRQHLDEIYRITQNTLVINGYPDVAVRTGQQGVNIVSFYLHPNGDISHLRLIKPMGYEVLDKNTLAVIQTAYKDYPRPKTKTKIVFYVNYQLY
ncbi:TonB family protein [Sulfurovum sp. ST-21]|uniref:TonB family protein n=1 Tax=Sulfurovum indicum TaxID=2779528 RepID=A0A7M1S0I2_9BACT|nr:energy transducer TonB [Sulfurovum indicum]QOR61023.1 TonB family protein [Sulfurovum indicum]